MTKPNNASPQRSPPTAEWSPITTLDRGGCSPTPRGSYVMGGCSNTGRRRFGSAVRLLRFAVGSASDLRSSMWTLVSSGERDFYLITKSGRVKWSFHASGDVRYAFIEQT